MSFLSNFVEGFTGSGMFLGPPRHEQTPLLEPDAPDPERIYLDLNYLFNADEETIAPPQKAAVAAEVLKIIRKAGLASEQTVGSGTSK
jgi:hypothetical protein